MEEPPARAALSFLGRRFRTDSRVCQFDRICPEDACTRASVGVHLAGRFLFNRPKPGKKCARTATAGIPTTPIALPNVCSAVPCRLSEKCSYEFERSTRPSCQSQRSLCAAGNIRVSPSNRCVVVPVPISSVVLCASGLSRKRPCACRSAWTLSDELRPAARGPRRLLRTLPRRCT